MQKKLIRVFFRLGAKLLPRLTSKNPTSTCLNMKKITNKNLVLLQYIYDVLVCGSYLVIGTKNRILRIGIS